MILRGVGDEEKLPFLRRNSSRWGLLNERESQAAGFDVLQPPAAMEAVLLGGSFLYLSFYIVFIHLSGGKVLRPEVLGR